MSAAACEIAKRSGDTCSVAMLDHTRESTARGMGTGCVIDSGMTHTDPRTRPAGKRPALHSCTQSHPKLQTVHTDQAQHTMYTIVTGQKQFMMYNLGPIYECSRFKRARWHLIRGRRLSNVVNDSSYFQRPNGILIILNRRGFTQFTRRRSWRDPQKVLPSFANQFARVIRVRVCTDCTYCCNRKSRCRGGEAPRSR